MKLFLKLIFCAFLAQSVFAQTITQPKGVQYVVENGVQIVTTDLKARSYADFTVKKGMPVKFIIKAAPGSINGCNNEVLIPAFKIKQKLKTGDNVFEFTPTTIGTINYSCWMNMIRHKITVID